MIEEDPPAGVPEWVVTYGDMMSLLLTFFIMLVSLSEVNADKKYRAMLEAIHKRLGYHGAPLAPSGKNLPLSGLTEKLQKLGSSTNEDLGRGGVRAHGPEGLEMRVLRRDDGVAINIGGGLGFAPASADLSPALRDALTEVAAVLAGKPNKVEIRGHASADPLPPEGPISDKTQLGYLRARRIYEQLVAHGVDRQRLRVSSAGDSEPLPPTGEKHGWPADRVEILVSDAYASDFEGSREVPDYVSPDP